ncbi:MAG: hypothetical protein M3003_17685 [Candidatus Dormibacteraeota bacterium]|nr:hypothetical protein [Candidatus Dormibacteraeota bacterium]
MNTDSLERRLTDLTFEAPDPGRITARVLSMEDRPRRRQVPRLIALGVATLVIAASVLYFVPAADAALAGAPVAGDLLRDAGLVGAGNRVTSVGVVADAAGFRLQLVGAYADSARTVLLLRADPAILPLGAVDAQLTDQFGRTYHMQAGQSDSRTGQVIVEFEALAWPDALTGARIKLAVTAVEKACPFSAFCSDPVSPGSVVRGSWMLPAVLGVDEGTALPMPAVARLGDATYRFTDVRATQATIAVDIEITGITIADLEQIAPTGGKGTPRFSIELVGPNGEFASASYLTSEDLQGVHVHFLGYRFAPGEYHLHVSYLGSGDFERVLSVP